MVQSAERASLRLAGTNRKSLRDSRGVCRKCFVLSRWSRLSLKDGKASVSIMMGFLFKLIGERYVSVLPFVQT